MEVALERGVEGIIFATTYHRAVQVPNPAFRLPLVLVDCFARIGQVRSVVPDEFNGGLSATKLLLEKGHRRIAMINADQKYVAAAGRFRGYCRALEEFGVPIDQERSGRAIGGRMTATSIPWRFYNVSKFPRRFSALTTG